MPPVATPPGWPCTTSLGHGTTLLGRIGQCGIPPLLAPNVADVGGVFFPAAHSYSRGPPVPACTGSRQGRGSDSSLKG
ncbi:hypothetical protein AGIG_G23073 [Arapaima gigas]